MKINEGKHIGRVLFVVEGSSYEFNLLKRVFVDILNYDFIQKRRNGLERFINGKDHLSRVAVINTAESNIRDITENDDYLQDVFTLLIEKYDYPVDNAAIFYLFDRDPKSNTDIQRIRDYINMLKNPYENKGYLRGGELLLSYPSIESYLITALDSGYETIRLSLGKDAKEYVSKHNYIQLNKLDSGKVENAARAFGEFVGNYTDNVDSDDFYPISSAIFEDQENDYISKKGFRLFSMLTLALIQLGIITE